MRPQLVHPPRLRRRVSVGEFGGVVGVDISAWESREDCLDLAAREPSQREVDATLRELR
jgi:hypothetical protein